MNSMPTNTALEVQEKKSDLAAKVLFEAAVGAPSTFLMDRPTIPTPIQMSR